MNRSAKSLVLAVLGTLVIMYVAAFIPYAAFAAAFGIEPPQDGSPAAFLLSVAIVKLGLAFAFVLLFYLARDRWTGRWPTYALIWWVMFAVAEVGQAVGPGYGWLEAVAGMIAEAIYCPASAWLVARLVGVRQVTRDRPAA